MVDQHYDVIIVGLGAMGSAALYQTVQRGATVLGIDRFTPPHTKGSSHGDTRVTRQAIGEGEMYMPFIQRSNEIWNDLEEQTGRKLYLKTGGLIIAPQDGGAQFHASGDFVERTAHIAQDHHIEHEVINADAIHNRYPNLIVRPHERAYYEPASGVLRPELCIQTQLEVAIKYGASIHTNEQVVAYNATPDRVTVTTNKTSYTADKIILSAGAWMLDLVPEPYRKGLAVYRQVLYWFEAVDISVYNENNFPFVIWIGDTLEDFFTVFPTPKDGIQGVKLLTEQYHTTSHPSDLDRFVTAEEVEHFYRTLTKPRLKDVTDKLIHADVCMYTVTPDEHFVIDFHPESERVIIASPCSGHGFKHSSAIGESLAELALDGKTRFDIRAFNLSRLLA